MIRYLFNRMFQWIIILTFGILTLINYRFKKNMMQKRDIFRDRPLSPVDNAGKEFFAQLLLFFCYFCFQIIASNIDSVFILT